MGITWTRARRAVVATAVQRTVRRKRRVGVGASAIKGGGKEDDEAIAR